MSRESQSRVSTTLVPRAVASETRSVRHLLERRAALEEGLSQHDAAATMLVMLRVQPPPEALLVIRESSTAARLKTLLREAGIQAELLSSVEALARVESSLPPVALSDDVDFVRELRLRSSERHVYIIAVTSRSDGDDVSAFGAGADDCIGHNASREYVLARLAAARRIADVEASLRAAVVQNRKLSTIDELTRVASRRFFARHFPYEVERAARFGRGLSVIMCDIDFFKKVNDTYGHAGGDEVLREFSARITSSLRRGFDWVARLGGEEFAVILPETAAQEGLTIARQLRRKIGNKPFTIDGKEVPITASFGLCGLDLVPRGRRNIAERILGVADTALYNSKRAGRNRVTATRLRPRASDQPAEKAG